MPVRTVALLLTLIALAAIRPCRLAEAAPAAGSFELADQVDLDRADNVVLANLQRAKAYLADHQWAQAVQTLSQVMETSGTALIAVTDRRYVSVRDYCHLQLAQMPAEALALYRRRIDPVAKKWYDDGIAQLDRRALAKVVDEAFASTSGDEALLALGELALEAGETAEARWCWERILPAATPPGVPNTWLAYPDSRIDPAAVRARLILVSILEGARDRAREELAQFARLHPGARGPFGAREANYAEALEALLAEPAPTRSEPSGDGWPTFAGAAARTRIAPDVKDVGGILWRVPLGAPTGSARLGAALSCHPAFVDGLVAAATGTEILVIDARTGRPAWGAPLAAAYRDQPEEAPLLEEPSETLGVPRWTVTIHEGRLYARVGTSVTSRPQNSTFRAPPAALVSLDLAAEGRLAWKMVPEEGWAVEGAPLVDGADVYVAMRRSDIRPQAHVACLDARTGQIRWRRFVCAAETPARGMLHEGTHNLLTMAGQTIYYNTNLGAVAALSAADGQIKWMTLYARSRQGELARLAGHWHRDLTPCVYHRGTLLVAPADSPRIYALDASTGQILWQTGTQVEGVVDLLGATDEWLIASGDRLYWIGLAPGGQGRVGHVWPQGGERLGYGRGILAGEHVYWPTRDKIYRFSLHTAQPEKAYDLAPLGLGGGNLLVAGQTLVLATATELVALDWRPHARPEPPPIAVGGSRRFAPGTSAGAEKPVGCVLARMFSDDHALASTHPPIHIPPGTPYDCRE